MLWCASSKVQAYFHAPRRPPLRAAAIEHAQNQGQQQHIDDGSSSNGVGSLIPDPSSKSCANECSREAIAAAHYNITAAVAAGAAAENTGDDDVASNPTADVFAASYAQCGIAVLDSIVPEATLTSLRDLIVRKLKLGIDSDSNAAADSKYALPGVRGSKRQEIVLPSTAPFSAGLVDAIRKRESTCARSVKA